MKEKIQAIIADLEWMLKISTEEEDYEFCQDLKAYIDNMNRFMKDECDYLDIQDDVLEICIQRYEILKMSVFQGNRYVLFSSFGNWFCFWIDTVNEKSELWDEIREAQDRQEGMIMEQIAAYHQLPFTKEK